jgi:Uma2 family endonuclease
MVVTPKRKTLEEFLAMPGEKPALEYIDGEVIQKVSPSTPHSAATYSFCTLVNGFSHPRKLAWAFPEHRSTYGGRSTVPDVAVYTWDRIPRDRTGQLATKVFAPPDIAVEIRSPDQTFESNLVRCLWYVANGVQVAIAIEPRQLAVVAFRPGAEPLTFEESGLLDLSDVIPCFTLDIGALLAPLSPDWSP